MFQVDPQSWLFDLQTFPQEVAKGRDFKNYQFNTRLLHWSDEDFSSRKTMSAVKNNVHRLTYQPRKEEKAYKYYSVEELMRDLYEETNTPQRIEVTYKGGHVQRDLLNKLNIPSVNLELYGWSKYDVLKELVVEPKPICGFHLK
ncbi:hypothetical protein ACROYT_G016741 [Oculina patagonica]